MPTAITFMALLRLISLKQTNLKTHKSLGGRKVTIMDDRKCASPVGNVCSLMTIMIRIHYFTFVEVFESFNSGLISKFKGRIKNANESSLAMVDKIK